MTASVLTFGCRLNAHESDGMAHHARGQNNTIIVNTCAVTTTAERQARQAIRRAHRENPDAKIVVTGCASDIAPDRWAELPGVVRVVPNEDKLKPAIWGDRDAGLPLSRHARALLQVQQGCDHRCTFCIIPYGRGASRSTPATEAIARAEALVEAGHQEIVLTGVDIASWKGPESSSQNGTGLGSLCRELLRQVTGIRRLRLSSIDPVILDAENGDQDLWWLLENEPRLMPHLHLSLQAGSDLILKRMKRRHDTAGVAATLRRVRSLRPETGFGADLIAGFPTETEALFHETLSFVQEQEIPFLHVFPYSERPGTPAARMPSVPNATRQERAARLRSAGDTVRDRFLQRLVGTEFEILAEAPDRGHSPEFAAVRLIDDISVSPPARGSFVPVRATGQENGTVLAEIRS
ncbi:MiaB/RimO family radical SAM methylthiotransferase [Gluconobacter kanchanaburiensis]|uniref:tRNA (N(6)-L-threonylcarbamoyladenosine(37)-C(2) )-methylthiotransferase MtaB n=1 Tax=Gluconobacter kanchanaburiensis NBRC 103587 TaxID=1307948 RepID=A0A511B9R2_9PROT|nr:MiaB/RimO family radical SAM methylthiotransferase [Gluconobacter kanchanaburiensis]MBF0862909.1 MiaB/RimO family radical SAM methylthiotransferase [Gluconobacter kanchanaburiensis]GBR72043.1 tRNA 2-methylthioadenosine synthase MiaB [Gluconobacter kanchanaburiensis NBRC 103587]GEK97165.1 tRNA (N(6)-L-threonylcarbamoyladenosine(37)-C(2))-methylthiotransferase MtaB [Gluconobacter kanchanaburiensis NBRC 103587]